MTLIDWLIMFLPVAGVMYAGWYARRLIVGISDFLVAGRVCRRYVISTANIANALGLVTLTAFIEVAYKTGFALSFWNNLMVPLAMMLTLTGYCLYRFRETRAMSIGQFLEMRYSRRLRIFASLLRSIAEIMANTIMPAIAARFFIAYLDLPRFVGVFGFEIPTFLIVVGLTLTLAISLICMGGTLAIVITDTVQGLFFYPSVLVFIVFVLFKFSWSGEILEVMGNRVPGESFINPYDISGLRDFNLFMLFVTFFGMVIHGASGVTGNANSAASAHESKMASILGAWRGTFSSVFYVVLAIGIITLMNHANFAGDARTIRTSLSLKAATELIETPGERQRLMEEIGRIPPQAWSAESGRILSQHENPDEVFFDVAQRHFGLDGGGSSNTQQFKTLFRQMMLPTVMRHLLPPGLVGLFGLMMLLFIISTDDSRIYSASSTIVQDCIVPFYKAETLSLRKHVLLIRVVSIGVGVVFLLGSWFMAQLEYINLFINIMYGMWLGGCGPMIVFGFYSRFGTTAGAWASLLTGMGINMGGILIHRNWAALIYPWLERQGWVEQVGNALERVSSPFSPYIVWEMNRLKCPVNSYEIYFFAMVASLTVYILVSLATSKRPFNLDRMLHRGAYNIDGENKSRTKWTWRSVWGKLIGITPDYSRGDKVIAWSVFTYSFVYHFLIAFVLVVAWNAVSPWPVAWWGRYFLAVSLVVPGIAAAVSTVWFGIGCSLDLAHMFRDLRNRVPDPLDNGMVQGHVSISERGRIASDDDDAGTEGTVGSSSDEA